jgi:hypothetical protein
LRKKLNLLDQVLSTFIVIVVIKTASNFLKRNHTHIINYFVEFNHHDIDATLIVINMLKSALSVDQIAAVKCLEKLTNESEKFCERIYTSNGLELLVNLLRVNCTLDGDDAVAKSQLSLTLTTLSVLCNVSDNDQTRERLSTIKDIGNILNKLLNSKMVDIQSRASILIADICSTNSENRDIFAQVGCLEALIGLLDNEAEDLLVNSINAIDILCQNNLKNQTTCVNANVFLFLVDLLNLSSGILLVNTYKFELELSGQWHRMQTEGRRDSFFHPIISSVNFRNLLNN